MPTNRELEIIMKLKDEVSKRLQGIEGNLQKFANSVHQLGLNMRQVGREIYQVGSTLTFIGAALTGPLALAFKSSEKYSLSVSNELKRLDNAFIALRVSIAEALVPVVHQLANVFGNLLAIWNSIPAATQQMIIQGVAITGIFLTLSGAVVALIGRLIRVGGIVLDLVSKFALFALANPWLVGITAVVAGLIIVFLKFRDVAVPVLNAIEIGAEMVYIGFVKLIKYLLIGFDKIALGLEKFYDLLGKIPGRLGEPYRQASEHIKKFRENLDGLIKASDTEMDRVGNKISDILVTGEGSLVKGYDKARATIENFINSLKNLGKDVKIEEVAQKFDTIKTFGEGTARSLGSVFKRFFSDVFKGQMDDIKDYFAELGNMMLEVLAEVLAKMILVKTIGSIFPGMIPFFHQGGMVYHSGGEIFPIRAHTGLAVDEVPIIAQAGEGILSRRGMAALGGGENLRSLNEGKSLKPGITINVNQVIQAWDSQDVWRNRKMLSNVIADDIYNNGKIRSVIRNYT
jgi:methyl-accepting chemotaxis protein